MNCQAVASDQGTGQARSSTQVGFGNPPTDGFGGLARPSTPGTISPSHSRAMPVPAWAKNAATARAGNRRVPSGTHVGADESVQEAAARAPHRCYIQEDPGSKGALNARWT